MTQIPPGYASELAECYASLASRVFGYARARLGVDPAGANDLVQQAFEAAAKQWAVLRDRSEDERLRFLFAVAWCGAADDRRRVGTARQKRADIWRISQHPISDPFEAASLQLLVERLNKEIASMPTRRGEVARLKWCWQMSNQEIAEALGITDKAVSSHVAAARASLRQVCELLEGNDGSAPQGGRSR